MNEIEHVHKGMQVIDSDGAEVGNVDEVKMGDPEAVTTEGQRDPGRAGLLSSVARGLGGGPGLPRQEFERLLRVGYVKVDKAGAFSGSTYLAADTIDRVSGDVVYLTVRGEDLGR